MMYRDLGLHGSALGLQMTLLCGCVSDMTCRVMRFQLPHHKAKGAWYLQCIIAISARPKLDTHASRPSYKPQVPREGQDPSFLINSKFAKEAGLKPKAVYRC